jgi:hypothetical protein
MTAGEGALVRTVVEGGAELAVRGLATRAATRVVETLGATGRAVRAGVSTARDYLNPTLAYEQGATELHIANGYGFRSVYIPRLQSFRLFGDHPVRSTLEFWERLPAEAQDSIPEVVKEVVKPYARFIGLG